jgi:hypothetical protein
MPPGAGAYGNKEVGATTFHAGVFPVLTFLLPVVGPDRKVTTKETVLYPKFGFEIHSAKQDGGTPTVRGSLAAAL